MKTINFKRNCPICDKEIGYTCEKNYNYAEKTKKLCNSCTVKRSNKEIGTFKRNCPQCNEEILYKNEKGCNRANNNGILCRKCIITNHNNNPEIRKKIADTLSNGHPNPHKGKTLYQVWEEKYGENVAIQKQQELHEKYNQMRSGENNPMYGKQRPKGAGNGWSGHYKGYYFRSILELSYLKYLLDNDIKFENAEKKEYKIEYKINNNKKTYRPDFYLVKTKELIEIKPKKLVNIQENQYKFEAATIKWGSNFKILTEENINFLTWIELYQIYLDKDLIFDKNYEDKFLSKINSFI